MMDRLLCEHGDENRLSVASVQSLTLVFA